MSRAIPPVRPRARDALRMALSVALLVGSIGAPVAAQDQPSCTDQRMHDCVLPDWSEATQPDIASIFGEIDGAVWIDDIEGDVPTGGLDIRGVGLGLVDIADPGPIRDSDDLLKLGKVKKAVPAGPAVLVRVVLDRPADQVDGGHSSVHVATDIDGSRSNNAPSSVVAPDYPFAGSQDIYSLTWASTTGETRLLDSDLAGRWYGDKDPFAASWAAPDVLDVLIAPQAFGDGFRVISHVAGRDGGYDSVSIGLGAIPVDGRVGLIPSCIEGSISAEPFVVRRLVENGQTLRNVEAPASWHGGAMVPLDDDIRDALEAFIEAGDDDGDGRIGLASTVSLFEDGVVIRQRPLLELALDGDNLGLALELGLTRRGYNVLRDLELESSGDPVLDAWLERATDALEEHMPPFRSTKQAGLVAGAGIGSCIPWLEAPARPVEPGPETPGDSSGADAAAGA